MQYMELTKEEKKKFDKICDRSANKITQLPYEQIRASILAGLDADRLNIDVLTKFDDSDFMHDIVGYLNNLDDVTFTMDLTFLPKNMRADYQKKYGVLANLYETLVKNYFEGNITICSILEQLDIKEDRMIFDKIVDAQFSWICAKTSKLKDSIVDNLSKELYKIVEGVEDNEK